MVRETMAHESAKHEPSASDVFEALANEYRRRLLFALDDEAPLRGEALDPLELLDGFGDPDTTHIELVHVHLPKLSERGFIDWNRETDEITTGAEWGEVEPVIGLLREHWDELPVE